MKGLFVVLLFLSQATTASSQVTCQDAENDKVIEAAISVGESSVQSCQDSGVCDSRVDNNNELRFACNRTCGLCLSCPFNKGSVPCKHAECWENDNNTTKSCIEIACLYCENIYNDPALVDEDDACQAFAQECEAIALAKEDSCPNHCSGRGSCLSGQCWCLYPYTGVSCGSMLCQHQCVNGHCDESRGLCSCDIGWEGDSCEIAKCMDGPFELDCNYGLCNNGTCHCFPGYSGTDCSTELPMQGYGCATGCSGHGNCVEDACVCETGFWGADCSGLSCPLGSVLWNNGSVVRCGGNGMCDGQTGECVCFSGWVGLACTVRTCDACVFGSCIDGTCVCDEAYRGPDCSIEICPNQCSGQGQCVSGRCLCFAKWEGADCAALRCPSKTTANKCSGNGKCLNGTCECFPKYGGLDCSETKCLGGCGNGECLAGICSCTQGWTGAKCDQRTCVNECSRRGICNGTDGQCDCFDGFAGSDCSKKQCPNDCSGRGSCVQPLGICDCLSGFFGEGCEKKHCPGVDGACDNRGSCDFTTGTCQCKPHFSGSDCTQPRCTDDCNFHGKCVATLEKSWCECQLGWNGDSCGSRQCTVGDGVPCSGNGNCNGNTGGCECFTGFWGPDCEWRTCPSDCRGRGECDDGICVCHAGFRGFDCSMKQCPGNCSGHGHCKPDGVCDCEVGFATSDCSKRDCASRCSGNGVCDDGKCHCNSGWTGQACDLVACQPDCVHGSCMNGRCHCEDGFAGSSCELRRCPSDCSGNGECDTSNGLCLCNFGYARDDCSQQLCLNGCENGGCISGECICHAGWKGIACDQLRCPNECSNNGQCLNGQCICKSGTTGEDCSIRTCSNNCNMRGICNNGTCECVSGFWGGECQNKRCLNACSGHGDCVDQTGTCDCRQHWQGPDCSQPKCSRDCFGHGLCVVGGEGKCTCDYGWTGEDCSLLKCPRKCSHNGVCHNGTCACFEGFLGRSCNVSCVNNCTSDNHGACDPDLQACRCKHPFYGEDCSQRCVNDCSGNGLCQRDGKCACFGTFVGDDCSLIGECPQNCNDKGTCYDGVCTCNDGYGTYDGRYQVGTPQADPKKVEVCSDVLCPQSCSGRGICNGETGECSCDSGWSGAVCNFKDCPSSCSSRGFCNNGTCECFPGFTGADCSEEVCPHDCSGHGECHSGCCGCADGWVGTDCSLKDCPMQCSDRGQCNYALGECNCYSPYFGDACEHKLTPYVVVTPEPTPTPTATPTPTPDSTDEPSEPTETPAPTATPTITATATPTLEPVEEESESDGLQITPEVPKEIVQNEEQNRPIDEYAVFGALQFSIPFADWGPALSSAVLNAIAQVAGVDPSQVAIVDITYEPTVFKFKVRPQNAVVEEFAEEIARHLNNTFAGDFMSDLIGQGSFPLGTVMSVVEEPQQKALGRESGCKRCRNGREQAENDHRTFSRKCNRDGSCTKRAPWTINDECARGCADHCMTSCKRFHDPKTRKCAATRRKHERDTLNSLQPDPLAADDASRLTSNTTKQSKVNLFVQTLIQEDDLAPVEVEDSIARKEVYVIADCYADCSRTCVEKCVGEFGDPIPSEYLPPEEEAKRAYNPPPLSPVFDPDQSQTA